MGRETMVVECDIEAKLSLGSQNIHVLFYPIKFWHGVIANINYMEWVGLVHPMQIKQWIIGSLIFALHLYKINMEENSTIDQWKRILG